MSLGRRMMKSRIKSFFSITSFYHKNIVYNDTVSFDIEYVDMPKGTDSVGMQRLTSRVSFADAVSKSNQYTVDSIPKISSININGIYFNNKKILLKLLIMRYL